MTGARLAGTTAAMAAIAGVLAALTPPLPELTDAVLAAQETADSAGAEALLLAATGLLAWGVWAWGALGLLLTAAAALPGALGRAAGLLVRVVLPGGARRAATLALGLGLGLTGPVAGTALLVVPAPAAAAGPTAGAVPDWPAAVPDRPATAPVPDWPAALVPLPVGSHVVVRGDCLWDLAAAHLADQLGRLPSAAEVAGATRAWWATNADVIGPDPDVLLPGQVLRPPP
jgi:nucleoid-associated protein YgaU